MSNFFVPSRSPIALALREPNLLVPNRQPTGLCRVKKKYLAGANSILICPYDGYYDDRINRIELQDKNLERLVIADGNRVLQSNDEILTITLPEIATTTSDFTVTWRLASIDSYEYQYVLGVQADIGTRISFYNHHPTAGKWGMYDGSFKTASDASSFLNDGLFHTCTVQRKNGTIYFFEDGKKLTGTSTSSDPIPAVDYNISGVIDALPWNGQFQFIHAVGTALSDGDILALHESVYSIFEPANDAPYLYSVGGGGPATITGTGALSAGASSLAGTGVREITGTAALASQAATIAGTGTVGAVVTGTGALAAQASSLAGTGVREITATGALASQASAVAGTGVRAITGTAALADQAASIAGTGVREITSTGALASQASDIDGTGTVAAVGTVTGTGALAAQSSAVAGTGLLERTGTGALAAGLAVIDATGIIARTGTGALAAQISAIAGTGIVFTPGTVTGTASLICGVSSISGVGAKSGWSEIEPESTTWTPISEASTTWTDL